jgi:selenide,water dikinase
MAALNRIASEVALRFSAHAATDITGFGLAGHAAGIARESRLTLEIEAKALPLLPSALELAQAFQPAGLKANRRQFEPRVAYETALEEELRALLFDPQTSGGLLLLLPEANAASVLVELPQARRIGRAVSASGAALRIV